MTIEEMIQRTIDDLRCSTCIHFEVCAERLGGADLSIVGADCRHYKFTKNGDYSEGYKAGKQVALLQVQSDLHDIALNSQANYNEVRYENLVVMLSDVDKVIKEIFED